MGNGESTPSEYVLDDPLPIPSPVPWQMHPAISKLENTHMSVFVYDESLLAETETETKESAKDLAPYADNAVKYLKKLRHPGIIKLLDVEYEDESTTLLTEEVTPLALVLNDLTCDEICAGLYNVVETLMFLHEKAGLCHNNLNTSTIFVSKDDTWKIGGMDHMCRFEEATPAYLCKRQEFRLLKAIPAEEKSGNLPSHSHYGYTRDAYAFGIFAEELLEYLTELGDETKTFELRIQDEFLNDNPTQRPHVGSLLEDRLFRNEFTTISNFLKRVTLKTKEEKVQFFRTLTGRLRKISPELLASRLVPLLMSRFVLLEPTLEEFLLPHLLTPENDTVQKLSFPAANSVPLLPERLFCKHVVPEIFKLFHVRETQVRKILLCHFHSYVHCFEADVLEDVLMPKIMMGLRDTDNEIVYFTLHALAELVPILGGETVVGGAQFKIFAKNVPNFKLKKIEPFRNSQHEVTNSVKAPKMVSIQENSIHQDEKQVRRELARIRQKERQRERQLRKQKAAQNKARKPSVESGLHHSSDEEEKDSEAESLPSQHKSYSIRGERDALHRKSVSRSKNTEEAEEQGEEEKDEDREEDEEEFYSNSDDSDFDREIEDAISAMPSTLPNASPKFYEPAPKVDWSDVKHSGQPQTIGGVAPTTAKSAPLKGVLKLKVDKPKQKRSPPPPPAIENKNRNHEKVETVSDDWDSWGQSSPSPSPRTKPSRQSSRDDSWNSGWGSVKEDENLDDSNFGGFDAGWGGDWGGEETIHSPAAITSSTKTFSRKQTSDLQGPLGAEFDVLSIQIKKKSVSSEDDFFADMAPDLKPMKEQKPQDQGEQQQPQTLNSSHVNLFAVEGASEDATGWDNEEWEEPA